MLTRWATTLESSTLFQGGRYYSFPTLCLQVDSSRGKGHPDMIPKLTDETIGSRGRLGVVDRSYRALTLIKQVLECLFPFWLRKVTKRLIR
jgi:hypothetical protein